VKRVVVIGAGPSGIAAAIEAQARGLDVTVLEQGEVGSGLRRFGQTRFFSPLRMNLPPRARELLGQALPPDDELLTAAELADLALVPLARAMGDRVKERHRVRAVGRHGMLRGDFAAHPVRHERPFRLLVETPSGEVTLEADVVLDASGVPRPAAVGAGGLPAPGERDLGERMIRDLGALEQGKAALANRRVLVVGHGHSAANAVGVLDALVRTAPATRVVWATRSMAQRPCVDVPSDPLPERARIVGRANDLASGKEGWLRVERRAFVQRIDHAGDALDVLLSGDRRATVDAIVALTGSRPDLDMLSELALDISPTTEGAGGLARALANVTDCLSVPAVSPADLASGEPGFHLVGAKSYGRARTFLLQTGYGQIRTLFDGLSRM
jgi:hypothetical protein